MTVSIWIYILGINFTLELHDSMQWKAHGNSMELRDISFGHKMASMYSVHSTKIHRIRESYPMYCANCRALHLVDEVEVNTIENFS